MLSHESHDYTSYFENWLTLSQDVRSGWPQLGLYYADQHGKFDIMTDAGNDGFKHRRSYFKYGRECAMYTRPNIFPFISDRIWPGDVNMRLEIDQNSNDFMLM